MVYGPTLSSSYLGSLLALVIPDSTIFGSESCRGRTIPLGNISPSDSVLSRPEKTVDMDIPVGTSAINTRA